MVTGGGELEIVLSTKAAIVEGARAGTGGQSMESPP